MYVIFISCEMFEFSTYIYIFFMVVSCECLGDLGGPRMHSLKKVNRFDINNFFGR